MLDAALKTQLQAYLERVTLPFDIVATLDGTPAAAEMRELLGEIAEMSDKITLRTDGDDARNPSFLLRRAGSAQSLRFATIPLGH